MYSQKLRDHSVHHVRPDLSPQEHLPSPGSSLYGRGEEMESSGIFAVRSMAATRSRPAFLPVVRRVIFRPGSVPDVQEIEHSSLMRWVGPLQGTHCDYREIHLYAVYQCQANVWSPLLDIVYRLSLSDASAESQA